MTKTNATAKVSYVEPIKPKAQEVNDKAKEQGAGDVYKAQGSDAYKGLIGGKMKAESLEGGVLEEMFESASDMPTRRPSRYDRVQDLLGGFMMGSTMWKAPEDVKGEIPYIPKVEEDFGSIGVLSVEVLDPIVNRYVGLEMILIEMLESCNRSMHRFNMARMSAGEYRSLEAHKRKLIECLQECRDEGKFAKELLAKQKAKEFASYW